MDQQQNPDPEQKLIVDKYITREEAEKLGFAFAITRSELGWEMEDLESILQAVFSARVFLENIDSVLSGKRTLDYVRTRDEFVFDKATPEMRELLQTGYFIIENPELREELQIDAPED